MREREREREGERERDQQGIEPLYRPRYWTSVEEKRITKSGWFRGKECKNETVVFVPATSGSELKKRYQKTIQKAKVKVEVVKVLGTSVKRKVHRSEMFMSI